MYERIMPWVHSLILSGGVALGIAIIVGGHLWVPYSDKAGHLALWAAGACFICSGFFFSRRLWLPGWESVLVLVIQSALGLGIIIVFHLEIPDIHPARLVAAWVLGITVILSGVWMARQLSRARRERQQ